MGCILAGVYTSGALEQLWSVGFKILYFTYDSVIEAFNTVGIDARFDEQTPDAEFDTRMAKWKSVPTRRRGKVWAKLVELNQPNVDAFMAHVERAVKRQITAVRVTPLHGAAKDCVTVDEAVTFVDGYDETAATGRLVKYEVLIRYDNGDKIEAQFQDKATTVEFLRAYQTGNWTPAVDSRDDDVERGN